MSLTVSGGCDSEIRCPQSCFHLRIMRKNLFHAVSGLLVASGIPQLVGGILHLCEHIVFPLCLSVTKFPLFISTPLILD